MLGTLKTQYLFGRISECTLEVYTSSGETLKGEEMRFPAEVGEVRECFSRKADIEDKPLREEKDGEWWGGGQSR